MSHQQEQHKLTHSKHLHKYPKATTGPHCNLNYNVKTQVRMSQVVIFYVFIDYYTELRNGHIQVIRVWKPASHKLRFLVKHVTGYPNGVSWKKTLTPTSNTFIRFCTKLTSIRVWRRHVPTWFVFQLLGLAWTVAKLLCDPVITQCLIK